MAKLRAPTKAERAAGLPTSKAEAIERGLTRFIPEDGQERIIRKYGTKSYPVGTVEKADSRKSNRGGGTDGSRKINERTVTPDKTVRNAADRHMAKAAQRGKVSHHGLPIAKLAEGERQKPGTVAAYEKVHGKGNVGHSPGALYDMDHADHDYIHHKQEPAMHKSIKNAGKQSSKIFAAMRGQNLRASMLGYLGYISEIDEITGGHVDKLVKDVVGKARNEILYSGKEILQGKLPYGI